MIAKNFLFNAATDIIPVKTFMKMRNKISSASSRPETEPVALPMIKYESNVILTGVHGLFKIF